MTGGNTGPSENAINQNAGLQQGYGQAQAGLASGYNQISQGMMGQFNQLNQPSIDYYKAITSGNPAAALSAVAPQIGNVAQQTQQSMANIGNSVPEGAGRDYLMGQAQLGQGAQNAALLNNAFTGALQGEQGLAGQALGGSLQEQGASLSGYAGATNSLANANQGYSNVMQAEVAKRQAFMSMLGALAGAAGTAAGGGAFSDVRLKEDIKKVGELGDVNLYSYRFRGDDTPQLGVLAQEVYTKHPEVVVVGGEDPHRDPWLVKYSDLVEQLIKE